MDGHFFSLFVRLIVSYLSPSEKSNSDARGSYNDPPRMGNV